MVGTSVLKKGNICRNLPKIFGQKTMRILISTIYWDKFFVLILRYSVTIKPTNLLSLEYMA